MLNLQDAAEKDYVRLALGEVRDVNSHEYVPYNVALRSYTLLPEQSILVQNADNGTLVTLKQAIDYELVDTNNSLVKDPNTGHMISVTSAINNGVIRTSRRITLKRRPGQVYMICNHSVMSENVDLRKLLSKTAYFKSGLQCYYAMLSLRNLKKNEVVFNFWLR